MEWTVYRLYKGDLFEMSSEISYFHDRRSWFMLDKEK